MKECRNILHHINVSVLVVSVYSRSAQPYMKKKTYHTLRGRGQNIGDLLVFAGTFWSNLTADFEYSYTNNY